MIPDSIQSLIGCGWGRVIRTEIDPNPCPLKAQRIVVLHGPDTEFEVRLCAHHLDVIDAFTTPHNSVTPPDENEKHDPTTTTG